MKVTFYVSPQLAIKQASENHGEQTIDLDLSKLTQSHRDLIASKIDPSGKCYFGSYMGLRDGYPEHYKIGELTEGTAILALDTIIDFRKKEEEEEKKKIEGKIDHYKTRIFDFGKLLDNNEYNNVMNSHLLEMTRISRGTIDNVGNYFETEEGKELRQKSKILIGKFENVLALYKEEEKNRERVEQEERKKAEEEKLRPLREWAMGIPLLKGRIELGFEWKDKAAELHFDSRLKFLFPDLVEAGTPDGYEYEKYSIRGMPTLEEMEVFREVKEILKDNDISDLDVELNRITYTSEGLDDIKRTELRISGDDILGCRRKNFFLID